jgi:hypothetical protein
LPRATISCPAGKQTSQVVHLETEPRPRGSGNARPCLVAAQAALWGRLVTCGGLSTRQKDAAGEPQTCCGSAALRTAIGTRGVVFTFNGVPSVLIEKPGARRERRLYTK